MDISIEEWSEWSQNRVTKEFLNQLRIMRIDNNDEFNKCVDIQNMCRIQGKNIQIVDILRFIEDKKNE